MTTRKEMSKMNRMVETIRKEKKISKVRLVMQSGISISYYEKLKPFVEELFANSVRYNRDERMWEAIESQDLTD